MRRRLTRLLPLFVLVVVAGAGATMAASAATAGTATVKTTVNKTFGTVLVGSNGHTLYRYTPDKKGGASTCKGQCLKYWPKLTVKTGTKPTAAGGATSSLLGTVKSGNGQSQVTYGGYPLYFFSGDKKAGQVNGQGSFKTWYVVNTKGALVKSAFKATATTSTSSSGGGWG